jgi:outer membrane protein assembly factor BamA
VLIAFSDLSVWAKDKEKPLEKKKKSKNRIVGSPIAYYTPETSLAFGVAGSYIFRLGGVGDKVTRPSSVSPVVIYTLKKQFITQLTTNLFFKNNSYHLSAEFKAEKFPNKFYGTGNDTLEQAEELFTPRRAGFRLGLLKQLSKGFYLGLQYEFRQWDIIEKEEGRLLDSGLITGSEEGTISGVMVQANYDTRDHLFAPTKGNYHQVFYKWYPEFLGSTTAYTTLTLDLRRYFPVFSNHIFAARAYIQSQAGEVPFTELGRLGGPYLLRGYYEGRYRDKNLAAIEAEYRLPLFWRIGMVVFGGFADIGPTFSDLDFKRLKPSYGLGLRFLFDKKEKIWVRLDVAFGKGASGFYISVFEAF